MSDIYRIEIVNSVYNINLKYFYYANSIEQVYERIIQDKDILLEIKEFLQWDVEIYLDQNNNLIFCDPLICSGELNNGSDNTKINIMDLTSKQFQRLIESDYLRKLHYENCVYKIFVR